MVHFVGAGSGAADLITVRGAQLLSSCDAVLCASDVAEEISEDKTSEFVFCEQPDRTSNAAQRVIDIIFFIVNSFRPLIFQVMRFLYPTASLTDPHSKYADFQNA